jgi:hypothetical protein
MFLAVREDDGILYPAHDGERTIMGHYPEVAGIEPAVGRKDLGVDSGS